MHPLIEQHRLAIRALAARRGIQDVRVFGSMAQGEIDVDRRSDIDLLVSLPADQSGLALGGLLMDVQELTKRNVEVVTEASLAPSLREQILREAQPL